MSTMKASITSYSMLAYFALMFAIRRAEPHYLRAHQ